jgi:hypothetical protein
MAICTTGKWIDKRTGQVVDSQPEESRLLVAPGTELTAAVQEQIRRAEALAPTPPLTEPERTASDEEDTEPAPETTSMAAAPETAASTGRTGKARQR